MQLNLMVTVLADALDLPLHKVLQHCKHNLRNFLNVNPPSEDTSYLSPGFAS